MLGRVVPGRRFVTGILGRCISSLTVQWACALSFCVGFTLECIQSLAQILRLTMISKKLATKISPIVPLRAWRPAHSVLIGFDLEQSVTVIALSPHIK
ncbi:putative membrane protein [Ranid herpesvirus 3]|uniref:Putative membrane protein n=1 Tax=Ranid herpesvirus 3 TaxID=1987509 RepID=A0A1X9T5A3_9VIRU|nr:putative membrane protein [Ranid herpesvirus 3]ARR28880.1 putative membrane protein [Ranid herpesvirus 3]